MTTDGTPNDFSDAVTAIGRLAIAFSTLEGQMHFLAWDIIDPQRRGMGPRITDGMSAANLAALLTKIAIFSSEPERVAEAVTDFRRISSIRNTALHSITREGPEGQDLHNLGKVLGSLGSDRDPPLPISVEKANETAFECHDVTGRVRQLISDLSDANS